MKNCCQNFFQYVFSLSLVQLLSPVDKKLKYVTTIPDKKTEICKII
jgi:hypothetical protein